ncbi:dolichyl-phosphate beta-glucosyltransferase [Pararge aegeria]|uniref:Dolichyl-phosphate beta-glucosyltransferase n=2 Tax=Pararge aegeria TaxID=116150 RepID=A0A8S4S9N1_9NEOP|nr:dolichyl-phosphate beta-glucosyltransferase [Pararge aegeria]CAH2244645.1 jg3873 [Pararge aegeria aegeria]
MDITLILSSLVVYGGVAAASLFVVLAITIYLTTKPFPIIERVQEEETYNDTITKTRSQFPKIDDPHSVNLSVVVPAYNEEERLPPMLDEALEFLEKRTKEYSSYKYEIIIVSDGSKDNTVKLAEKYVQKYGSDKLRCLNLIKNRGKGGAVRLGILSSRGATILFADADGASKFEDLVKLEAALKEMTKYNPINQPHETSTSEAIVIGSRAHLEKESLATRSLFRNILMYGFHFLVWLFTVKGIKDTQCGFKLFTRKAADICFQSLHVNRWAFDVELLYIAQKLNIPISEIPIRWTEIEGSKVTPIISWIQMGCDLGLIWLRYQIGAWKIKYKRT